MFKCSFCSSLFLHHSDKCSVEQFNVTQYGREPKRCRVLRKVVQPFLIKVQIKLTNISKVLYSSEMPKAFLFETKMSEFSSLLSLSYSCAKPCDLLRRANLSCWNTVLFSLPFLPANYLGIFLMDWTVFFVLMMEIEKTVGGFQINWENVFKLYSYQLKSQ